MACRVDTQNDDKHCHPFRATGFLCPLSARLASLSRKGRGWLISWGVEQQGKSQWGCLAKLLLLLINEERWLLGRLQMLLQIMPLLSLPASSRCSSHISRCSCHNNSPCCSFCLLTGKRKYFLLVGRNARFEEFIMPRLHSFNFCPVFLPQTLVIFHSNCFPDCRMRLEGSTQSDGNFPARFPARNTGRMPWGSCWPLFPPQLSHCPPLVMQGRLVLLWLCSGCFSPTHPWHKLIQVHWVKPDVQLLHKVSRMKEEEGEAQPPPRSPVLLRMQNLPAQFCWAWCPTFIPHIAQLKIHWDFRQGPCCELSERAGVAAAPVPAMPAPCRAPSTIHTSPEEEKKPAILRKSMPLLPLSSGKRWCCKGKMEGGDEITVAAITGVYFIYFIAEWYQRSPAGIEGGLEQ